jgi:hypothetical protein
LGTGGTRTPTRRGSCTTGALASGVGGEGCEDVAIDNEIAIDLEPVLLSDGIGFFGSLDEPPVKPADPEAAVTSAAGVVSW